MSHIVSDDVVNWLRWMSIWDSRQELRKWAAETVGRLLAEETIRRIERKLDEHAK